MDDDANDVATQRAGIGLMPVSPSPAGRIGGGGGGGVGSLPSPRLDLGPAQQPREFM